jgi:hypothetical protein
MLIVAHRNSHPQAFHLLDDDFEDDLGRVPTNREEIPL